MCIFTVSVFSLSTSSHSLPPLPLLLSRRLKDLTAYNMERTITILGTIDNCKKAESLISAKLRASYESDMAQFIPVSVSGYKDMETVAAVCMGVDI